MFWLTLFVAATKAAVQVYVLIVMKKENESCSERFSNVMVADKAREKKAKKIANCLTCLPGIYQLVCLCSLMLTDEEGCTEESITGMRIILWVPLCIALTICSCVCAISLINYCGDPWW